MQIQRKIEVKRREGGDLNEMLAGGSTWNGWLHACIFGCKIQFLLLNDQVLDAVLSDYIFMAFADLQ